MRTARPTHLTTTDLQTMRWKRTKRTSENRLNSATTVLLTSLLEYFHAAASLKRGKPVCILPWKKRKRGAKVKKKQKEKASKHEAQTSNVDCVASSLERAKVSGIKAKSHVTRYQQGIGTKSHPAMFYSYYIAKGNAIQYRKICTPKRRPCDGYFGCCDDGSVRGKKSG